MLAWVTSGNSSAQNPRQGGQLYEGEMLSHLSWVELRPSKRKCPSPNATTTPAPQPVNVTLSGNRIFADVMK